MKPSDILIDEIDDIIEENYVHISEVEEVALDIRIERMKESRLNN